MAQRLSIDEPGNLLWAMIGPPALAPRRPCEAWTNAETAMRSMDQRRDGHAKHGQTLRRPCEKAAALRHVDHRGAGLAVTCARRGGAVTGRGVGVGVLGGEGRKPRRHVRRQRLALVILPRAPRGITRASRGLRGAVVVTADCWTKK
jgi:hypothetical protein